MSALVRAARFSFSAICGVLISAFLLLMPSLLLGQATASAAQHEEAPVRVPFVGCNSDGQVGPVKAPQAEGKVVSISAETAQHLAYYKSQYGVGTLAPRNWYCFGVYGANGVTLYVSPEPMKAADLFSAEWPGFTGPAIQISEQSGDTHGRFAIARTIARVFPAHSQFVRAVIAEGIEPASAFPSGPYSDDKLTYHGKDIVEFQTPANAEGLGTDSRLRKNGRSISGIAILFGEEPNLLHLSVRLPEDDNQLTEAIIQQTENDVVSSWQVATK